ncbi:hypothetical protein AV654_17620 [Paenibacillus elgii]|uniref:Terminase n=1 Tax=Paenibacillus elgii TaxID=189691 RepID=A0A163YE79_9BACL|nr:hypothetical protein [Paenibacillus elgii]KZE79290.1 hypothetical protein AV654_17620 [Paenibacillus elgii]
MVDGAISKLKAEMEANKDDSYIQYIGQFLLQRIEANPDDAAKLASKDKTIAKSLEAMRGEAKKKQKNGMAMLTPDQGFAIVLKYFGITGAAAPVPAPVSVAPPAATVKNPISDFDVKLDDFL